MRAAGWEGGRSPREGAVAGAGDLAARALAEGRGLPALVVDAAGGQREQPDPRGHELLGPQPRVGRVDDVQAAHTVDGAGQSDVSGQG
uniref:Uncharacterized protein n=1 Tax=Janibacter limosus TaxID=53458 RepID=A0AC61U3S1_9MICO|nr:hypothetical protein [Janibacter limosus]